MLMLDIVQDFLGVLVARVLDYTRRARVPPQIRSKLVENMTQTSQRLSDVTHVTQIL